MLTGADVVVAPALSVALAVRVCLPPQAVQVMLYGADVSWPSGVEPRKNSTFATVPSVSDAAAAMVIAVPAANVAPLVGLVTLTLGGVLPPVVPTFLISRTFAPGSVAAVPVSLYSSVMYSPSGPAARPA